MSSYSILHPVTDMLVVKLCMMMVLSMLLSMELRLSMTSLFCTEASSCMVRSRSRHSSTESKCDFTGVDADAGMLEAAWGALWG